MVPLAYDVDGESADAADRTGEYGPLFGTLPEGDFGPYRDKWHPALPHLKRMNVAFVGGHVLSSRDPEHETNWMWRYWPK
jgi:prepilin-type processing-associated H-X9-DG protein